MRTQVVLREKEWERLPSALAKEMLAQMTRDGLQLIGPDGKPTDRVLDYLVGALVLAMHHATQED